MKIIKDICNFKIIEKNDCILKPLHTHSHWISKTAEVIPVVKISIAEKSYYKEIFATLIDDDENEEVISASDTYIRPAMSRIMQNDTKFITITDIFDELYYEGNTIEDLHELKTEHESLIINKNKIITCEYLDVVYAIFYSEDPRFEKGYYREMILTKPDVNVKLSNTNNK